MLNRNTLALVAFVAATFNVGAIAGTHYEVAHPRRAEVNGRLDHQNRRIHNEMKSGEIRWRQAAMLYTENPRSAIKNVPWCVRAMVTSQSRSNAF